MGDMIRETRNRSRSKTPFLRSQCNSETCAHAGEEGHVHHHEKKKKNPSVQTIIEESVHITSSPSSSENSKKSSSKTVTSTTTSSSSSTSVSKTVEGGKRLVTSDYSSEDISPEAVARLARSNAINKSIGTEGGSSSFSSTTTTTVITTSAQKLHGNKHVKNMLNAAAAVTSTPKAAQQQQSFASAFGDNRDLSQHVTSSDFEKSSQYNSKQFSGSNNSSSKISYTEQTNGSLGDHIAYKEYKDAGEYWNKVPKTDYVYSKRSPHRREIMPGVIGMPNMSRRSLENHHDRVTDMIHREPAKEAYIRRKYAYQCGSSSNKKAAENLIYDSQDEVDLAQFESYRKSKRYLSSASSKSMQRSESWFSRSITTVVTTFFSLWTFITGGSSESDLYKTRITQKERGFFGSIGHAISSVFLGLFRYIYLVISSVLSLDTWLLKSSNPENKSKKRFLLLLLLLLPLLLLAAWVFLEEHERHALILRAYNFLPFTLASLRNHISGFDLQGLFTFPKFESSQHTTFVGGDITSSLKKSLSSEEYENILNHVNAYVQKLVDAKMEQQLESQTAALKQQEASVSPAMLLVIANTVRESIQRLEPILVKKTQSDVFGDNIMQRIVENVQVKLEDDKWAPTAPVKLSEENLKQISNLIQKNIEVNNHHYNIVEKIDLEGLLVKILQSPKLAAFVDARILAVGGGAGSGDKENEIIARQQLIINELNKEIDFIKTTLADKLTENEDLHLSINNLKLSQDSLLKRVDSHESLISDRFSALLAEIEQKLSLLRDDQFALINQQVKLSLVDILGFKHSGNVDNIDLQNWIRNTFVAKDFLEQKLLELSAQSNSAMKDEMDRSGVVLMKKISEQLKVEILKAVDVRQKQSAAAISGEIKMALSENEIKKIVKGVLAVYDADKTGLVDYALESAGGQILSTRCTENYQLKTAQISIFGIPLWYPSNTPRIAISPNVQPGECWAFQGFPGFLVLRLNTLIRVSGFTLEHIPRSLTPNGRIDSAPRNFTVWGLEHENDHEPVLFGEYEYADNDAPLQYFPVQNGSIDRLFDIVEMRIETNHGNPQYTCLYRFRVHGKPPSQDV